jgi:subtilisin family serine protease
MRDLRRVMFIGTGLALAACADMGPQETVALSQTQAPLMMANPGAGIPNQYIVVMKKAAKGGEMQSLLSDVGVQARRTFSSINGFSADLDADQLEMVRQDPNVDYVEQNQMAYADVTQLNATWGLDRIDQRDLPLNTTYRYGVPAFGIHAYIIDTGVASAHPGFNGQAANVFNSTGDGNPEDCNGHGTHVAGTIGSQQWGVAKGAFLYGVKVLGCGGGGTFEGVIAGIDWVRNNHTKPAVANMSLGGGFSAAVNTATDALSDAGVFIAVASGNSNANACNFSPASAPKATTVNASERTDAKAGYSNHGNCSDVWAPGSAITSLWLNGGTNTISGTSMASPHVAGVGALYKANFGDAPSATVDAWIKANATPNKITGNPAGTPNLLLFKGTL